MGDVNFNAYELIELDPSVTEYQKARDQFKKKSDAINRLSTTLPGKAGARRDLFKIYEKDIAAIIENEVSRLEHARQYRSILDSRLAAARPLVDMVRAQGCFSPSDVTDIAAEQQLPEEEVRRLLSKAGVPEASTAAKPVVPTYVPPDATPQNVAETIKNELIAANVATLYEFIGNGFGPASSEAAIRRWCDETDARLAEGGRGTPRHVRDTKLLGHIRTNLLNRDARKKYDNLLANTSIMSLEPLIRMAGRQQKVISRDAMAAILKVAKARGVPENEAEAYVRYWVSKTKGWSLQQMADDKPLEPLPVCGFCHELGSVGDARCYKCGREMIVACPSCRQKNPTERATCQCGFPIGDLPLIEREMLTGRTELAGEHLTQAAAVARKVLATWPNYSPAGELLSQVDRRQKQLDGEREVRQNRVREAERRASARQFVAAAMILGDLSAQSGASVPPDLLKRVSDRVAEGHRLVEAGRRAEATGDLSGAVRAMEAALAACVDLEEAAAGLRRFPPPPPSRLSATVLPTCIRLEWQAVAGSDLRYAIRRKEGGAPASAEDGDAVGESHAGLFDDTTATNGRAWNYAVFTVRGGLSFSRPGTVGPALRPGRPVIERAIASRGTARITVTPPHGCERIAASRSPAGGSVTQSGRDFEESGLRNGTVYTYSFRAQYRNPAGGNAIQSESVSVSLTPEEVADPLSTLALDASGPLVRITWTPPRLGRVVLRTLDREPSDLMPGLELDLSRVATIGSAVPLLGPGSAQLPLPTAGRLVVVPLTVTGSTAVVGTWQQVNRLPEVDELSARPAGTGRIELQWTWPAGVTAASVALYGDAAGKTLLRTVDVTRQAYEQVGGFAQIESGGATPLLARVECISSCGSFRSKGATTSLAFGRRGSVSYHIENGASLKRLFNRFAAGRNAGSTAKRGSQPILVVESEQCQQVRDLVLVGLPNRPPLSADDGEVVTEIEEINLINGRAEVSLPIAMPRHPLFVKAFIRRPELQPDVRLQPASKDQLILKPA